MWEKVEEERQRDKEKTEEQALAFTSERSRPKNPLIDILVILVPAIKKKKNSINIMQRHALQIRLLFMVQQLNVFTLAHTNVNDRPRPYTACSQYEIR